MHFKRTVPVVACCFLINFSFIKTEQEPIPDEVGPKSREEIEDISPVEDEVLSDAYTFVVLIDVVFQDGKKRFCSGAIIHDNVVVTAAHCFVHELDESIQPEISASFVVIGTGKMYDAGYEQYLPIERVVTHPKYDGWSADLCLVYTFAGMTSGKPGKIIKMAGEKSNNQADYNITVYSWRLPKDDEIPEEHYTTPPTPPCDDSSQENADGTKAIDWYARGNTPAVTVTTHYEEKFPPGILYKYPVLQQKLRSKKMQGYPLQWNTNDAMKKSRYLSSNEESGEESTSPPITTDRSQPVNLSLSSSPEPVDSEENERFFPPLPKKKHPATTRRRSFPHMRNWRRLIMRVPNNLYIEGYNLVSAQICKKILENAFAPRFLFNKGEVTCYNSDDHILTDDDSGAPVVRHSKLIAVTIGGAECDGEHVGVGLKMSCYCSWIADNIPGGNNLNCCKNCCDVKHTEPYVHRPSSKKRRKNKYLLQ